MKLRTGLVAAGVATLSACAGGGSDDLDVKIVFDERVGSLVAAANRAPGENEKVYLRSLRGRFGQLDCNDVVASEQPAAGTYEGDTWLVGAKVDPDLLKPFYGPDWGYNPTPEMLKQLEKGTDAIAQVCVVRDGQVVKQLEMDLFKAWDNARAQGVGGKAYAHNGEVRIHSVQEYGERCIAELGEIPFFDPTGEGEYSTYNCLESTPIPMTVTHADGTVEHPETEVSQCDKPQYIYSSCEPGPRVATRTNEEGTRWTLLCRKSIGGYSSDQYNDIAMIGHNPFTGKTCYFQNALYEKKDGGNIPHPADVEKSTNLWSGIHGGIGSGIECAKCHSADAWIHTPWIDGAKDEQGRPIVPKMGVDPDYEIGFNDAPYTIVNAHGQGWTMPKHLVSEEARACTNCHRYGDHTWTTEYAGRLDGTDPDFRAITTEEFRKFHNEFWMPPSLENLTEENWATSPFGIALNFIKGCSTGASDCEWAELPDGSDTGGEGGEQPVDLPDAELALSALQILGANVEGATDRCNDCHGLTKPNLRQWQEYTDIALETCLNYDLNGDNEEDESEDEVAEEVEEAQPVEENHTGTVAQNEFLEFGPFTVEEGGNIAAVMTGTGDADLYLKHGSAPTTSSFDCRPYSGGSNEQCHGTTAGEYFIAINGYDASSDYALQVVVTPPEGNGGGNGGNGGNGGGTGAVEVTESGTVTQNQFVEFGPYEVPAGSPFKVVMTGTGDADLYLRKGAAATTSQYDCRPYSTGSSEDCEGQGPGKFFVAVNGYATSSDYTLTITYQSGGDNTVPPIAAVNCMRSDPNDDTSYFEAKAIGIFSASAHLNRFRELFKAAYPVDEEGNTASTWAINYTRFRQRVSMPQGNHPKMTQAEFNIVLEWFKRGLPLLDETLPDEQNPDECVPLISEGMVDHVAQMSTQGWTAVNKERGLNMMGCDDSGDPLACLASFPRATQWENGNSNLRLLRTLDFTTSFWMRSSADGRFVANGGGNVAGSTISDIRDNRDLPVSASYDPGFFPDNSGFVYHGTNIGGAGFCNQSLLAGGADRVTFQEAECSAADGVGIYQHLGAALNGGDYFIINGQHTNDNGGHGVTLEDPAAHFSSSAEIRLTPMVHNGSNFVEGNSTSVATPFEGDNILSPSTSLIASRLAGPEGKQLGYVIRRIVATPTETGYDIEAPALGTICVRGGKAAFSFDERVLALHHYVEEDDWAELGFPSASDPTFVQYRERGAANIYAVDISTGQKIRVTNMQPGQYALYPHFRSDGWMYFLVRDSNTDEEFVVASDIGARMSQ